MITHLKAKYRLAIIANAASVSKRGLQSFLVHWNIIFGEEAQAPRKMLYIAKRQVRMHDAKATEISAKTISSIVKLLIITLARYYLVNLFVNISLFGVC
jgi:hypothetical protein